jgi:hypothetical protein
LVPRRYLTGVLLAGVLTGVLFRLAIVTNTSDMGRLLMPGSLDSFCIGGLLAYGRNDGKRWYNYYLGIQQWFVLLALALLLFVHLPAFRSLAPAPFSAFYLLFITVAFGILINRVTYTVHTPVLKQVLNNKALLYIGKISYGVYLFHNFIPYLYEVQLPTFLQPLSLYIVQGLRFIVLMVIASVSWFLIEKPVLQLKSRFEYNPKQ